MMTINVLRVVVCEFGKEENKGVLKMVEAYPLQYPLGWKRTFSPAVPRFNTSFRVSRDNLLRELRLLKASSVVISSNVPLKNDGLPYADVRVDDGGVAVYFVLNGRQQCIPCDKWKDVADNLHAIEMTVGALRGIERWGAKEMVDAAFSGFQALPDYSRKSHFDYFSGKTTRDALVQKYHLLCKELHPDKGGDSEEFSIMSNQFKKKIDEIKE